MLIFARLITALCFLVLAFSPPLFGNDIQAEGDSDIDRADPESIDIYREDAGDFLDFDTSEYAKAAREAYDSGDYEKAAQYYLAVLKYNINDGNTIYNLACCYGLLGDANLAAEYVERAVNSGFEDIGHISWDPDFDSVRGQAVFDDTVDRLASIMEEKAAKLGDVLYFDSPAFFECRIHLPENYDPAKSYPLVVGLHGYGSNPDRFITLWERFANRDFIYASPRAPYPFLVGEWVGYSWDVRIHGHRLMTQRATAMTEAYVARVVKELTHRYKAEDVYLLGFSQGCAFAYQAGIKNHELFHGLICFGGWLDTDWLSEECIGAANELRVFIAHGTEDRMVDYESGIAARDYLEEHGYHITFYEFDGAHSVPEDALQEAERWMKG
jgi:phospholipase/carboxylesterase